MDEALLAQAYIRIHRDLLQLGSSAFTKAELAEALMQHMTSAPSIESTALLDALHDLGFIISLPTPGALDSVEIIQLARQIIDRMESPARVDDLESADGEAANTAAKHESESTVSGSFARGTRVYPRADIDLLVQPVDHEELEVDAAEQSIERSLAALFLRLGPPPEPTELDYSPAGSGDGGAHQ
ncbi:putative nucleotidyltransferase [Streptomyces canus]|uniref:hypothetical protein n=1 Tax=Streptomyces canus TaxID=58343 RepID=UPI002786E8E6|nr:hypothetical protein [Streptomyces canus]MDQ0601940.1 putative nucleotidyltransferase [Streptomyces canus]